MGECAKQHTQIYIYIYVVVVYVSFLRSCFNTPLSLDFTTISLFSVVIFNMLKLFSSTFRSATKNAYYCIGAGTTAPTYTAQGAGCAFLLQMFRSARTHREDLSRANEGNLRTCYNIS